MCFFLFFFLLQETFFSLLVLQCARGTWSPLFPLNFFLFLPPSPLGVPAFSASLPHVHLGIPPLFWWTLLSHQLRESVWSFSYTSLHCFFQPAMRDPSFVHAEDI